MCYVLCMLCLFELRVVCHVRVCVSCVLCGVLFVSHLYRGAHRVLSVVVCLLCVACLVGRIDCGVL